MHILIRSGFVVSINVNNYCQFGNDNGGDAVYRPS